MFDIGFPRDWSSLKKLIWLKAAISGGGASAIWKTVTGTLIHLTDALASPMQKCEVTLEPIQDLHGQDAPYPAGGGKNKLQILDSVFAETHFGLTFTKNPDGSVKVTGTSSGGSFSFATVDIPAGTYYFTHGCDNSDVPAGFYINLSGVANSNITGSNFTISEDKNATLKLFVPASGTVVNGTLYPMICLASETDKSYSPYSNICPITGWTGCEVKRTGKNLFDANGGYESITYTADGSVISREAVRKIPLIAGNWTIKAYFKQPPTDTYYLYGKLLDSNNVVKSNANIVVGQTTPTVTVSAASGDSLILYNANGGGETEARALFNLVNIQLEQGSTATEYEPYNGTTLSVTFPDTVYGGKYEFVSGKTIDDHYMYTTELATIGAIAETLNGYPCVCLVIAALKSTAVMRDIRCSHFPFSGNTSADIKPNGIVNRTNSYYNVAFCAPDLFTTVSEFRAWVTENNVQLYTPRVTPAEISLTPQEISTLAGENNVWSNTNSDTTVIYKAQAE